jgi:hypothetical protein
MAEVVNSLFGITPESLQADRDAALQAQALQYAKLDPFQRATAAIYSGANRLGGAVGGMLGAQDPEMMRIRQRQQLLEGADISDPKVLRERATIAMQQNDYAAAQQLASRAMDIEAKQASTAKDLAAANKETKLSVPARVLQAQAVAELKDAVRALKAQPETPEIKAAIQRYEDQLQDLEPAEKTINFGAEAERYAKDKFGKPFSQLTPEQAREVNKKLEALDLASKKAGKTDVVLPGVSKAGDVTGLRRDLQAITKPYQDQADAAGDAVDLANMAIKTNNFAAAASLSRSLATASGEKQITSGDVTAFNVDPSLVGTVSDTLSRLTKGRPTVDTLVQLRNLAEALKKKAESRISIEERQLQDTARVSGQFTEPQIQTVFRRRPKDNTTDKTSFNSVAEAEAAKLPKGTIITINGRRAVVE